MFKLGLEELLASATEVVQAAGERLLQWSQDLQVQTKSWPNDLVTAADKATEEFIASQLARFSPYPLLGEEAHQVNSFAGRVWVLDPIDGTMNFVATHRDYAISLALCQDGVPVLAVVSDPVARQLYTALAGQGAKWNGKPLGKVDAQIPFEHTVLITDLKEILALQRLQQVLTDCRGHRRYGSAALECIEVAKGQAGGFIHLWVSPWDIAAATLICEQVGILSLIHI